MARNCLSCDHAAAEGDVIRCGFNVGKALEALRLPMAPVLIWTARRVPVKKDRVPNRDCPAFREIAIKAEPKGRRKG